MRNFAGMTLAVLALIAGAFALWMAVWLFWTVIALCAVYGCFLALGRSVKNHYHASVFAERRLHAVEAVERLRSTIVQYEKNDVLIDFAANSGCTAEMQVALDNARFVAADMDAWLVMICEYNHRRRMPLEGLQLSDVASRVDGVNSALVRCFFWLRQDRKGPRPAMLTRDWYSLEMFFPNYDRLYGNNFPPALTRRPVKLVTHNPQRHEGTELLHDHRAQRGPMPSRPVVEDPDGEVSNVVADMAVWRQRLRAQA